MKSAAYVALIALISMPLSVSAQPTDYEDLEEQEGTQDSDDPEGDGATGQGTPDAGASANAGPNKANAEEFKPSFYPPGFDLLLSAGFASVAYPHLELGGDLPIIPLPNGLSISIGASVDFGYCLLCAGFNLVSDDLSIESYFITLYGRANFHLGVISKLVKMPELDPYVGVLAGPTTYQYRFSLEQGGEEFEQTASQWALSGGVALGLRYAFDSRWIVSLEYRYLLTVGYGDVSVNLDGTSYTADDDYANFGSDAVLGVGIRF